MSLIFKDEVIYITGASAGIGFATAKLCMEQGATVVITGRNKENLKQAETELQKISSNVIAHNVDVSDESAILESLNEVHRLCGKIDGLVNNAPSIHTGRIVDLSLSAWKTNFKANLDAVFLTTKTVLPWMMAAKKGSIVNIASVVGLKGVAYMSAYGAAKAGLINFSRAAAVEAAPHIRVNCLIPGAVLTPATERAIPDEAMMSATINSIPLKRIAEPIELAKPIAFLLSSDASFITGASLVVDGGKTADLNAGN
ncbi:SDR family oxidoreductase [Gammaproteobacteria bacterium]|nr:SDR family oxidoreductase [Gammaproteobacteria bacterium]MDB9701000.1 SDR family oxidoreductase [Gammaproteobacteria bacterium]MDC0091904.1 SDR family oxidoreductase [Gammaproteobacteria bacterium]